MIGKNGLNVGGTEVPYGTRLCELVPETISSSGNETSWKPSRVFSWTNDDVLKFELCVPGCSAQPPSLCIELSDVRLDSSQLRRGAAIDLFLPFDRSVQLLQ